MPSKSKKQRDYIFYLRSQDDDKSKWFWDKDWEQIEEHRVIERYKPFFEYAKRKEPAILYHSTSNKFLPLILKQGLKRSWDGFVYLMEKPEAFDDIVFEVKIPNKNQLIDWREAWYDENDEEIDMGHQYDPKNPYWIYPHDIPAKYIRVLDKNEKI